MQSKTYIIVLFLFWAFGQTKAQKINHAREVHQLFTQLKANGFDEQKPVSYHYFFQDKDQQNLIRFKTLLLQQNYSIVGITQASGKYQLEAQKTEAHTADSAIERGKQLSALAKSNGIETFDGFELKSEENEIEGADFSEEIETTPVNQLFAKALEFYDKNDNSNALLAFNRCIKLGINPEASYYKRGNCKTALGQTTEAISDLENVVRLNPNHYEANYNLGGLYLEMNNENKALDYYRKAVLLNPKSDNGFYRLAEIYQSKGMKNLAFQNCQKALQANPDNQYAKDLMKKLNQ